MLTLPRRSCFQSGSWLVLVWWLKLKVASSFFIRGQHKCCCFWCCWSEALEVCVIFWSAFITALCLLLFSLLPVGSVEQSYLCHLCHLNSCAVLDLLPGVGVSVLMLMVSKPKWVYLLDWYLQDMINTFVAVPLLWIRQVTPFTVWYLVNIELDIFVHCCFLGIFN